MSIFSRLKGMSAGNNGYEMVAYETSNNNTAANIVVGWSRTATFDATSLQQWIINRSRGGLLPMMREAQINEETCRILIPVTRNPETRSWDDRTGMTTVIPGNLYSDREALWERHETNGRIWLARKDETLIQNTIEKIFDEQRAAGFRGAALPVRTAFDKGSAIINVGDKIRYQLPHGVFSGTVLEKRSTKLIVQQDLTQEKHEVEKFAVYKILSRSSESQQSKEKMLQDFFTRAYGDSDVAKRMTQGIGAGRFAVAMDPYYNGPRTSEQVHAHLIKFDTPSASAVADVKDIARQLRLSKVSQEEGVSSYLVCLPKSAAAACWELLGSWSEGKRDWTMTQVDREDLSRNAKAQMVLSTWDSFYSSKN